MAKAFVLKLLSMSVICVLANQAAISHAYDNGSISESFSLEDLLNLEIVSATRSESKLNESPVPISVITAKEIASSGLDNIPDILARLPEIDVLHIGRSQTEVSIRGKGINFNRRLLTLIDGRTEYNDLFGVTLWHNLPISVDDIERIEVVRGPASALFGANAYSGVINIITKQADAENVKVVRGHLGQYGKRYFSIATNVQAVDNSHFRISYSRQQADSIESEVSFPGFNRIPTTVNFDDDDKSLDDMDHINFSYILQPSEDWNIHFSGGSSEGNIELFQQPGLPRAKWALKNSNAHGIFNWSLDETTSFQFNIYQNTFGYNTPLVPDRSDQEALNNQQNGFFFPIRAQDENFIGRAITLDYSLQFVGRSLEDKMAWVLGAERREIENKGGIVLDSTRDISSAFGNFTLKFDKAWIVGLGLRVDDDAITKKDIGFNSSLQYALSHQESLRVTARKAFRAPSLFELFSSVDLPVPNQNQQVNFRGNTLLDVETIRSIDITYTKQYSDKLHLTLEVFHEEYESIIGNPDSALLDEVEITSEGLFISTTSFQNLADAESDGFQAALISQPLPELKTYINYRFEKPKDLNSVAGETFFSPQHNFKLGGIWQLRQNLSSDLAFLYVGKTDKDDFDRGDVAPDGPSFTRDQQEAHTTINFALHYQVKSDFKNIKCYLVIDNVLDDEHVDYYEYDQILNGVGELSGRSVWGGARWNF